MKRLLLRPRHGILCCLLPLSLLGCSAKSETHGTAGTITVLNAGALAKPLRSALDTFARANSLRIEQESAGSLETVRKITELGHPADVVALADTALFSHFLASRIDGAVVPLGGTRMVLAYTPRSRLSSEITPANWYDIVTRPAVQVGRSDPTLDPAGYRALFVMQLAERYYGIAGLDARLERAAPPGNMRPKSADLVALLQTGNLDYAWEYESVALSMGLRYLRLPPEIDLGEARYAPLYGAARVVLPGPPGGPPLVVTGAPVVFGAVALKPAPHGNNGRRFITYLMSAPGRAVLANYYLDPL